MSSTIQFWKQQFGDEYHQRNRVDWRSRVPFWKSAVDYCMPGSVLEVGCGPGWNLLAIHESAPMAMLYGVDVNRSAVEEARQQGIEAHCMDAIGIRALYEPNSVDLVFTAGMLIHVSPDDLQGVMHAIVETSGRYVLSIEYEAESEEAVEYRGHLDKLWKRPYGELYEKMGLRLLSVGDAGGFDNCQYALLEKAGAV